MTLNQTLEQLNASFTDSDTKMPVLFIGHGNPMNALEDNEFSRAWIAAGQALPKPTAVLCVSAHWETTGTQVTAMMQPRTIHDFGGFPRELFEYQYSAPGSPDLARLVQTLVKQTAVRSDLKWGLDHGAWSVLCRLFPQADVPIIQLSLDRTQTPANHYALGKELRALRNKGVLIVGSGNIVHNLGRATWQDDAFDWAIEFDDVVQRAIVAGDHDAIIRYSELGQSARLAVPTNEHYVPLLYALAARDKNEAVRFFADRVTLGSISMRSLWIG